MKKIITQLNIKAINMIMALVIVWVGFILDLYGAFWIYNFLPVSGTVALWSNVILVTLCAIGGIFVLLKDAIKEMKLSTNPIAMVFNKSNLRPVKLIFFIIATIVIIYFVSNFLVNLEVRVLKIIPASNPVNKAPLQNMPLLPFLMLFEEAWTAVMLISVASFTYKIQKNKNYDKAFLIGSIVSAVFFGLGHLSAYFNGSIMQTIIHILLIQGTTRLILNARVKESDTFLSAYASHLAFDLILIVMSMFLHH